MVKQLGATCPGSPEGAIAGLGQVRHRLGSGLDLVAGGIGLGASAEGLRDHTAQSTSTVDFSAQAAGGAADVRSGGQGGPPNFTIVAPLVPTHAGAQGSPQVATATMPAHAPQLRAAHRRKLARAIKPQPAQISHRSAQLQPLLQCVAAHRT